MLKNAYLKNLFWVGLLIEKFQRFRKNKEFIEKFVQKMQFIENIKLFEVHI